MRGGDRNATIVGPPAQDQGLVLGGGVGAPSDWPGETGYLGLQFELDSAGLPTTHFGFVQLRVDAETSATPYAVHVDGFAYETDPDTPITTFAVPEPAHFL